MFETSVVLAQTQARRGRFSVLTVSVIAHTVAIAGAIGVSIASVEFPSNAPDELTRFVDVTPAIPPPLGNPNGGAKPAAAPAQPKTPAPQPQPNQVTAPATVPEQIPTVAGPSTGTTTGDPAATSTEPLGVPWGTKDSIGALDAPPAPVTNTQPVEEKIYEAYEVKAPVLIHKVAPDYPDVLRRTRMQATVIVRCIIDKNGRVRDPQITVPSMPPFNAAVLNAVSQWRYTPGSRNGVAVETYLNVTVNFSIH
ncbi:MAG: TonB family protein [Acidobacteriota bacterium]|nr:TonB family protein [Acidobacteriota bacterium]